MQCLLGQQPEEELDAPRGERGVVSLDDIEGCGALRLQEAGAADPATLSFCDDELEIS
jgi:hypothetical protein